MFEQFSIYPEIKYMAVAAAQAIGPGNKIQTTPDLENFKLERFKDLRKQYKPDEGCSFKLMLIGSSKTNIFIDGTDYLIDILYTKLPHYIGKPWSEIKKIELERSLIICENFLINRYCNPWVIDKFEFKEFDPQKGISYNDINDLSKADEICSKCNNFKPKSTI